MVSSNMKNPIEESKKAVGGAVKKLIESDCPECGDRRWTYDGNIAECRSCGFREDDK